MPWTRNLIRDLFRSMTKMTLCRETNKIHLKRHLTSSSSDKKNSSAKFSAPENRYSEREARIRLRKN
jgi:hypothetical protein